MKYLVRNTTTKVIEMVFDRPITPSPPLEVIEVSDAQYRAKMMNSIFTDVNRYKEFPAWGKKDTWWESNGTDWVDTRTEETVWEHVREKRNQALFDCDWTQLNDADITEEERLVWVTYRSALRDVPNSNSDPRKAEVALEKMIEQDKPVFSRSA